MSQGKILVQASHTCGGGKEADIISGVEEYSGRMKWISQLYKAIDTSLREDLDAEGWQLASCKENLATPLL